MKTALSLFTAAFLIALSGCGPGAKGEKPLTGKRNLITVNFQEGQTLQYRFVSSRDIEVDWGQIKSGSKPTGNHKIDKSSESLDIVVAYTPVKVDPSGLTTINATCKSVSVGRTSTGRQGAGRDAADTLQGASFTFTVEPTGKIVDYSQLEKLIKETAEKAFRPDNTNGRVKEPDLIADFIATQWFLWDSISSIERPAKGVRVGQSWKSQLSVPTPTVARRARNVTYTLEEIRQTEKGQLAVIRSSYSPAESVPDSWPKPYSGSFQISGRFGFLKGYRLMDLQGQGEELFNIDTGQTERYNQQYQAQLETTLPIDIGPRPMITIKQTLTMELIK